VDLEEIKTIIDLMQKNSITEFELEKEGCRIRLRRAEEEAPPKAAPLPVPLPEEAQAEAAPPPGASAAAHQEAEIKSPMVGTFYRAPSPDAAPYVDVGSEVNPDTVVCIIEAMKVMNEIKAEVSGVVTQVLVENGKPVEYGQPLFKVRVS